MTNDNRSPSEMLNRYQRTNFEIEIETKNERGNRLDYHTQF